MLRAALFGCLVLLVDAQLDSDLSQASQLLRDSLNTSVNPCEDFFEFACSKWLTENPIPKDRSFYDRYTKLSEQVHAEIKALYTQHTETKSSAIHKLKRFYNACMDTTQLNDIKTDELLEDLAEIGYWPIVHGDQWKEADFDLTDVMIKIAHIRAMDIFFAAYGNVDLNHVDRQLIHFDRGSLGMSIPQFYLNKERFSKQLGAYTNYMFTVAKLVARDAHTNRTTEEISADVKDIIAFETAFAALTLATPTLPRANYSTAFRASHLSDMTRFLPVVNWFKYFTSVMPEELTDYLRSDPEIIIANVRFFISLNELIERTPKRTLMNVMLWRFVDAWWLQLDERFGSVRHDYMRRAVGTIARAPRWKECAAMAGAALPYATDALYTRRFFSGEGLKLARLMFGELKSNFAKNLRRTSWMDPKTRAIAIDKAEAMEALIGAPDLVHNTTALDAHYKTLEFRPTDSYARMVHRHSVWRQRSAGLNLLKEVDRSLFPMSSTTINAAYTFVRNALTIPAAILQPPFFDASFPLAMNYGSIGSIISHEIIHGFDVSGSQFDKKGNRRNWWLPETRERFLRRSSCITKQYSSYTVPGTNGLHVDGFSTQGENMADSGGLKHSFRSYQRHMAGRTERRVPGFEQYDGSQLFYISFAMSYCGRSKPEEAVRQLYSDNHSPAAVRINAAIANQPTFARAFRCPKGVPMNPTRRCWFMRIVQL